MNRTLTPMLIFQMPNQAVDLNRKIKFFGFVESPESLGTPMTVIE